MWNEDGNDDSILEWIEEPSEAESRILVHGIAGFLDAGHAVKTAVEHLLQATDNRVLAAFDIDLLFDYRGRRPRMTYLADRFSEIDLPVLQLVECTDDRGHTFLLLHGVEPDTGWMTIVDTVIDLVESLDVSLTVGIQAFPFPAPHTRPIAVTAHSTDPMLIEGRIPWVGEMEVPGSLANYIELQLGREGHRAIGFAAHVPHYLANVDHPRSALTLLSEISTTTGLSFPLDAIRNLSDSSDVDLNAQLKENSENLAVVRGLEQSFDEIVASRGGANPNRTASGDDIAAQVEKFLAEMDARERDSE
jgi:hypothetical protein